MPCFGIVPWSRRAGVACILLAASAAGAEPIGFNRHIRPILADKCFTCHGPDSASRKADLRLDQRDAAVESGAIEPGKPDESELVARIFAEDADALMPPPASHKVLSKAERQLLREWIAAGATYEPHWSLLPPKRPPLPAVKNAAWVRNPIDAFVLAGIERAGMTPAAEADRRTLARRAALDATGLPPSPADVDAFVADRAADGYDKYLDRLFASPHWGEHRGRYWLDAARYGDTHGLHFDNYREMWSYRDWVIQAMNQNMPFDRFTVEQLAGDLLPARTRDQQIASGYNRCNITTNEGGTIEEENLVLYTRDRTETTAQIWMGLTANCAVCHDHKFDPLSQKEFYSLAAFFNNTTQGAMDGNIRNTPPVIVVPRAEDAARWDSLEKDRAAAEAAQAERRKAAGGDFDAWTRTARAAEIDAKIPADKLHLHLPPGEGPVRTATIDGKPHELKGLELADGRVGRHAIAVGAATQAELPAGDFDTPDAFSVAAWVWLPKGRNGAIVARMADKLRGWDVWLEGERISMHLIDRWPDDALKVVTKNPVKLETWVHLTAVYVGSGKPGSIILYVDGKAQDLRPVTDKLKGSIRTKAPLTIGRRQKGKPTEGVRIDDLRIYRRGLSAADVAAIRSGSRAAGLAVQPNRSPAERDELFGWWLTYVDGVYSGLAKRLVELEKAGTEIKARGTIAHVAEEKATPAEAYVLFRGEYDQRRERVEPATPAWLPPMPAELPRNRLGLARWLLRPEHPLAARVTVNRFWQELFGEGLVRTAGDFGVGGELPSHPELLDWLAVEFRESGWDVKRLFRLMMTSATYRQAATATKDKWQRDPGNRFLARGPRFRMDAEMVRDYALAASGLLVRKIGGPSVRPYQPDGVWEAVAMIGSDTREYKQDHGEALYRRSLYTFWKRAAPPASMEVLNAPSRETCTVRRERTNTPLQALLTLNDPQFVEAARRLAERAMTEGGAAAAARIEWLFRQVLQRPPLAEEKAAIEASRARLADWYAARADEAKALLAVGESKPAATLPPLELAAWTLVASQFLNLDEALNK